MSDHGEQDLAPDIGVVSDVSWQQSSQQRTVRMRTERTRRTLPMWLAIMIALALGWILGATLGARSTDSAVPPASPTAPPAATPSTAASTTATPSTAASTPAPVATPTPGDGPAAVVVVQAPLRGVAIPADVRVVQHGIVTPVDVDRQISASSLEGFANGQKRITVVDGLVVFMAQDSVMVLDPVTKEEPVEVATAIYFMTGSDAGRVWAVTSGSNRVLDVDVRAGVVRADYDLAEVGVPVGSFAGGLIVAPTDRSVGKFALWSPRRGVESLGAFASDSVFMDAGGNLLVAHAEDGMVTYNAVTGEVTRTGRQMTRGEQYRAIVSPDGSRVAVVERAPIGELPRVVILDARTGGEIDTFPTAFEWQLQWVSDDEIVYIAARGRAVTVKLRDTSLRQSTSVADLAGPNYWITVVS